MRLKEDKTNYRANSVIHKNTRNAKDELKERPRKAKKNTKKWCKGKVGVEHVPSEWRLMKRFGGLCGTTFREKVCMKCGKTLEWKNK